MIKKLYRKLLGRKSQWSIGFYLVAKDNPFDIDTTQEPIGKINARDITDCQASFVADPFLIKKDDLFYCFFEIKDKIENRGVIGVAYSKDGKNFTYQQIVLSEPFHLSYPAIYLIDGEYYMIPESGENGDVRLYKAISFPYKWEYQKTLLKGITWADPTLYFYKNHWYIFVSEETHKRLYIFYSDKFDGKYKPHLQNPIYIDNMKYARPAGHFFTHDNISYRFAQKCSRRYGESVYKVKIEKLTKSKFQESLQESILNPNIGLNWNGRKMHQLDYVEFDNEYFLVATDGEGYKKR